MDQYNAELYSYFEIELQITSASIGSPIICDMKNDLTITSNIAKSVFAVQDMRLVIRGEPETMNGQDYKKVDLRMTGIL